jgi:hypothetical protein
MTQKNKRAVAVAVDSGCGWLKFIQFIRRTVAVARPQISTITSSCIQSTRRKILPLISCQDYIINRDTEESLTTACCWALPPGQVLLPVAQEPAEAEGGAGRRQGAAVRRRVRAEQHFDDAAAEEEEDAAGGGPAASRAAEADGATAVAGVRAGQAGEAQVLHRGALQRHHGPDQDGQGRQTQQGLHLHRLIIKMVACVRRSFFVAVAECSIDIIK